MLWHLQAGGRKFWRPEVLQEVDRGGAQGTSLQQGRPVGLQSTEWGWRPRDLSSGSPLHPGLPHANSREPGAGVRVQRGETGQARAPLQTPTEPYRAGGLVPTL